MEDEQVTPIKIWEHLAIRPETFNSFRQLKKSNNYKNDDLLIKELINYYNTNQLFVKEKLQQTNNNNQELTAEELIKQSEDIKEE